MIFIPLQGRNRGNFLTVTSAMVGRIWSPGGSRVKVSQTLGVTAVVPVALVNRFLEPFK